MLKAQRIMLKGDVPTPLNTPSGCAFRSHGPIAQASCAEEKPVFEEHAAQHFVTCPIIKEKH